VADEPKARASEQLFAALDVAVAPLDPPFQYEEVHVEVFIAEAPADWEPTLDWEHDDYRWLPREEAADLLYWPEPAAVLRALS